MFRSYGSLCTSGTDFSGAKDRPYCVGDDCRINACAVVGRQLTLAV